MQNILIEKPYVPVPPYRGRIWPRLLSLYLPRYLRKKYGLVGIECQNAHLLSQSIAQGHGIILAPNHCRDEDPLVLGLLSRVVHCPFFLMASWHVFMQQRRQAFLLRRAGAFSIYREGIDRAAINTAVQIVAQAQRPLVLFPEGFISRTNDHLNELLDGVSLIARTAAKQRAKLTPAKKVVVHPVALRYTFQGDIQSTLAPALDDLESRLTWRKQSHLPLQTRIQNAGRALLALKEIEYLGHPQTGDLAPRLSHLIDAILVPIESHYLRQTHTDAAPARVKRLRSAILPDLAHDRVTPAQHRQRWNHLADLYLAQQLFHYPPDYLAENPSPTRLLETVERFEEDLTDQVQLHGPLHATLTVGDPIEVSPTRENRGDADPLLSQIQAQLHHRLKLPEAS